MNRNLSMGAPVLLVEDRAVAFVADPGAARTYDPENGAKLIMTGGGSDGTFIFEIVGSDKSFRFFAHYEVERSPGEMNDLNSEKKPFVWVIDRWTEECKPIIHSAMCAYKMAHGVVHEDYCHYIRFGTRGVLLEG